MTTYMPLKRTATIIAGQSPSSDDVSDLNGSGQPFLQGNAEFGPLHPEPRLQCDAAPKQADGGDILLSVRAPVGALNLANSPCGIGRGLCAIRPIGDLNPSFAWWALVATVPQLSAVATGSTYDAVSAEDVGHLEIPHLPVTTQHAIADYLDRETARIDALIAAKQRMTELLEERVWLAFTDRVLATKAKEVQLRRALSSLTDGPFGSAFTSSDYSYDGAGVIRLGNIGFSRWRGDNLAHIPLNLYERFLAYRVLQGDLLIAGLGDERNHAGRACVAPDLGPAIVKGKCFRGRVDGSKANAHYLALLLSSPMGAEAMSISGRGSTRSMINLDIVKSTAIVLPPLSDQESIVRYTRKVQADTDKMIKMLLSQIDLLKERRQALVTAAVTGQLDIPEAA